MTEHELTSLYEKLGFRIKDLREEAHIKQSVFAEILGLSRASIINIEKGRQRPSLHLLLQMSRALNVQMTYIIEPLQNDISVVSEQDIANLKRWKKAIKYSTGDNIETAKKLTSFITDVAKG